MKTMCAAVMVIALGAVNLAAQRTVTLAWTDTVNPAGTVYDIYRAAGACPAPSAAGGFGKIAAAINAKTFADPAVAPGAYCYAVAAVFNWLSSALSGGAAITVPPATPTGLVVTVASAGPWAAGTLVAGVCRANGTGWHLAGPPMTFDALWNPVGGQGMTPNETVGNCVLRM